MIFKAIFSRLSNRLNYLCLLLFRRFKIKENYIIFESEGDYTDNVKTFYDYLIDNGMNQKYKLIWLVHDPKRYNPPPNVVFVSRFNKGINWKANYYIAISKYFIFSHPYWLKKWRKGQLVINTSHSVAQLKRPTPPKMRLSDYVLCCSPYGQEIKQQALGIQKDDIIILGMPRIDLLYKHKDCIGRICTNYSNEKVILSMETFKQSKGWSDSEIKTHFAINTISSIKELEMLDAFLGVNKCKMLVKIHHLQDTSFLEMITLENIIYITDEILLMYDIQVNELLENADILLTDYSSVFYEFLLLNRPIGFQIADIDEYSRGFMMEEPLKEMPGRKIYTYDDLKQFIFDSINGIDGYEAERKVIVDKVFTYKDNSNCERLYNWLIDRKARGAEK